jgi:hypothetical protein
MSIIPIGLDIGIKLLNLIFLQYGKAFRGIYLSPEQAEAQLYKHDAHYIQNLLAAWLHIAMFTFVN